MPLEIDEDKLNDASMQTLDIAHPPVKAMPFREYPKMVYLHPKDKAKEHKHKLVHSVEEEDAAAGRGYRVKPHIPVPPDEEEVDAGEFETRVENNGGTTENEPAPKGGGKPAPKGKGK